jgi:hypothetical protein
LCNFRDVELDAESNGGTYRYALEIEHPEDAHGKPFIRSETVTFEGSVLYRFSAGEVQLFHDDETAGPVFPFRPDQSFLVNVDPLGSSKLIARLAGFKKLMFGFWVVQPNPFSMEFSATQDQAFLKRDGSNFPSYFSYLNSERPEVRTELERRLGEAIPGFRNLVFRRQGEAKQLLAAFNDEKMSSVVFGFGEFSEGQRVLAILHATVCGLAYEGAVLCFDEPDNFVSLTEIQPWLQFLRDAVDEQGAQALVISHHPEVMDYMAVDDVWRFERPAGPVIARPYEAEGPADLKLSELIVRGA